MTIFNNINEQTTCRVCGSKLSGQFVIGDSTIYLLCEKCEDAGIRNGFHYKMIGTKTDYMKRLNYLQVIDPTKQKE